MILVLDDIVALEFYRSVYPQHVAPTHYRALPQDDEFAICENDICSLTPDWISLSFLRKSAGKIGTMVQTRSMIRRSSMHRTRVFSREWPCNSFHCLDSRVFLPSVEFTFLLMASRLSLIELIALGHELCGLYSFEESSERGMRKRTVPLTHLLKLSEFVKDAKGLSGHDKASRAVSYISEKSASPMETRDKMQACLPYMLGGYCMPNPLFNFEVRLSREASIMAGQETCYIDLLWKDIMVGIEHQGLYDHLEPRKYCHDRGRINALRSMGYTLFEMTIDQVNSLEQFESYMLVIADKLHKRIPKDKTGPLPQRIELRNCLKAWSEKSGRAW